MTRPKMLQLAAWDYSFHAHLRPLLNACASAGFEVICAGAPGPFVPALQASGFRYVSLPFERSLNAAAHVRCAAKLLRLLRRERIDVVHSHTLVAGLIGRFSARAARVPLSVYTAHGFRFHENMHAVPYWSLAQLEKLGAKLGDYSFMQNEEDRLTALALDFDRPDRMLTIGSGIDLNRFTARDTTKKEAEALRRELRIPSDALVVTTIARPTRQKGAHDFLEMVSAIAARRNDVYFVALWPRLPGERHEVASANASDRVRFLGHRSDVPVLLAATDVFVHPSHYEGVSRVVMEAMAMGVAVVAADVRGCRELVVHDRTGRLFPARDVSALTDNVLALLENDALRRRLGHAAALHASRHFDERASVQLQVEIMTRLLQSRTRHHELG